MTVSSRSTDRSRDGKDPRAPHWFDFNKINKFPNAWTVEGLEWNDDPDADGVDDRNEGEVVRDEHRFVVTTWLQPRERTHDRYWSISYETVNQDGDEDPLAFHISTSQSIARNNLDHARDVLDSGDTEPHVLVRDYNDGPRETFEYPTEHMADSTRRSAASRHARCDSSKSTSS